MYGYIYKTTDLSNGIIYVGKKKSPIFLGINYVGSGVIISNIKMKCKRNQISLSERFTVELLEECESLNSLNEQERYWIDKLDARNPLIGYNLADGGDGGDLSEYIDYSKSKLKVGANNYNYGKPYKWINNGVKDVKLYENQEIPDGYVYGRLYKTSSEIKQHLSEIAIGRVPGNKGVPMTEEQKKKDSLNRKGKCMGDNNPTKRPDVKAKLRQKYNCPYCNNYISTKSAVTRHINKQHKLILESATTIESIDWKKYSIE